MQTRANEARQHKPRLAGRTTGEMKMTTTTRTKMEITKEIDALSAVEYMVATNSGTYGSGEACKKVGTGDPMFATRSVYETVGGAVRETGPDEDDAPGTMRRINANQLSSDRKRLTDLRAELRSAK